MGIRLGIGGLKIGQILRYSNYTAPPPATGLWDGLIAYWDMQESSGNIVDEVASLAGVPASTAPNYSQTGRIGNAINFNYKPTYGSGTRFDVGDDILQTNQVTVSAWIYLINENDIFTIISNNYSNTHGYRLSLGGANHVIEFLVVDGNGHSATGIGTSPLTHSVWYHVIMVVDGTNVTTYLNNNQETQESFAYNIGYGTNSSVTIGANYDNNSSFGGRIDELRIWNRALTSDERQELYELR